MKSLDDAWSLQCRKNREHIGMSFGVWRISKSWELRRILGVELCLVYLKGSR
jgi:hypothetical protein